MRLPRLPHLSGLPLEAMGSVALATAGAALVAVDSLLGAPAPAVGPRVLEPLAPQVERVVAAPSARSVAPGGVLPSVGRPTPTPVPAPAPTLLPTPTPTPTPSEIAPRVEALEVHPHGAAALQPGAVMRDVLDTRALMPVQGVWRGPPLVVHDNPESFTTPGVLGSTIAPVPGRGDSTYDLPGGARTFTLAQNRTGRAQVYSTVVENTSSTPMVLSYSGTVYSKKVTPVDGQISPDYAASGGFRGPHAVAAYSALSAVPGKNGFVRGTLALAPGQTAVLHKVSLHPGGEVFSALDLSAQDPSQTFGVASVASPRALTADDLGRLSRGTYPAAGIPRDFAPAGPNALGRPNGVIVAGSTFEAARTVVLAPGQRTGELFLATRFKSAGERPDLAAIEPTLGNPGGVGPAARTSDGSYGARYRFRYTLENPGTKPLRVEVGLTAPSSGEGAHRPLGGELTLPVRVDGQVVRARVDGRGEGRVLAVVEVPAGGRRVVALELVNVGNIFPPAGIELRAR